MNTVNITNIYCPGYSGSTILGTLLGCNTNIFFGGEINHLYTKKNYNTLTKHEYNAKLCSNHKNCDFFDDLIKTFEVNENLDKVKKYIEFIENKNITNLVISTKSLYIHPRTPITKYIVLFKNPCYLFASHLSYRKQKDVKRFCSYYEKYYNDVFLFLKKKPQYDSIFVSLEELCLNTKITLQRICNFLNVDFNSNMLSLNNYNSHMIGGNRGVRNYETKSPKPLKYDKEKYNKFVKNKPGEKYILESNAYKMYLTLQRKECKLIKRYVLNSLLKRNNK
jgi:hypothetical protein